MTVVGLHPEELFDKLLDGELLPVERERLQAHLDSCQVCRFEYAARLDFREEALELSAASQPPALPLRPLPLADVPPAVTLAKPRRRRSRRLVWGLAAAALISASGAVASGLAGKTSWRTVGLMLTHTAAPAEPAEPAVAKPARGAAVVSPAAELDSLLVDAQPVEAPVVAQAPPALEHDAPHAHDALKHRAPVARASLQLTPPVAAKGDTPSTKDDAASAPAKEPASAAKLFGEANQARRSGDIGRASGLYHLLQDQFPGSPEADLSRVTLALLLLDSGDAQGALSSFERYLAGASRGLEAEALVGRARALGRLGRRDLEAAAWREVQRKYPRSLYGRQAGERLLALGQP
jgi:TolA-binding protein